MVGLETGVKGFTLALLFVEAAWYSYQIRRDTVSPTITTWAMFLAASLVSFVTYAATNPVELSVNILNVAEILVFFVITVATWLWSEGRMNFRAFHGFYIAGAAVCMVFWAATQDPFIANVLLQVVMVFGYLPTIHTLFAEGKNVESYVAWGLPVIAAGASGWLAWRTGDTLALVYAGRVFVMASFIVVQMLWYDAIRG